MKSRRQLLILDIIEQRSIQTQEELADALMERGMKVTQATISRDIKELRLVKVNDSQQGPRYVVAHAAEKDLSDRQIRIFVDSVLSIQYNQSLVILKTISGSANAAAETIDAFKWSEILGCVAGDNTILVAIRSDVDPQTVAERFKEFLR